VCRGGGGYGSGIPVVTLHQRRRVFDHARRHAKLLRVHKPAAVGYDWFAMTSASEIMRSCKAYSTVGEMTLGKHRWGEEMVKLSENH
jgi:hypothetical protein